VKIAIFLSGSVEAVVRLLLLLWLYDSHIAFVLLEGFSLAQFKLGLTLVLLVLSDKLDEVVLD